MLHVKVFPLTLLLIIVKIGVPKYLGEFRDKIGAKNHNFTKQRGARREYLTASDVRYRTSIRIKVLNIEARLSHTCLLLPKNCCSSVIMDQRKCESFPLLFNNNTSCSLVTNGHNSKFYVLFIVLNKRKVCFSRGDV